MKIKSLALVVAILFVFTALKAGAAGRREPEEEKTYREKYSEKDWGREKKYFPKKSKSVYRKLDLTEEQKEELKKQKKSSYERKKELRGNLRDKLKEMREALAAEVIDKSKVEGLIDEISSLQRENLVNRAESIYEFRAILSDEQWEKIRDKGVEHKRMRDKKRRRHKDIQLKKEK